MIRQYNEVRCDICHKTKVTDLGKVPVDMVAKVVVDTNVHYENRAYKYEDVCYTCANKILQFIETLQKGDDENETNKVQEHNGTETGGIE